ncbi:MAG: glycosyltransferase family 4 protein [Candidatus Nanoperiomorbaceae bacterium]
MKTYNKDRNKGHKLRLTMLGWELPPYNSGGLGAACLQMAKSLSRKGADIDFILPYSAVHEEANQVMNVIAANDLLPLVDEYGNYVAMGAYGGTCSICGARDCEHIRDYTAGFIGATHKYADQVERLFRKLYGARGTRRRQLPDVIHAHDWLTMEAGIRARQLVHRPLIVHVHATEFARAGGKPGNPLIHEIEYQGLVAADRIFAVSQLTKDVIVRRYGIPADKIEVVHNAIDPDQLSDIYEATDDYQYVKKMRALGYKTVVNMGRMTIMKGLTHLLDAAQLALAKNPRLLFLISGSGEDRDKLIELAAAHGISDRVIFFPFVRGQRWRELYQLADMFVLPSVSEPFGLTPLEAAHYGTAILLSKTAGVGEILHHVLRFDYWDSRKLADQIINVSMSDALLSELRDNVRSEYLNENWDDAADKMLANYGRVMTDYAHGSNHSSTGIQQYDIKMEGQYA